MTIQETIQWAFEQWNLKKPVVLYERMDKAVYSAESIQWGNIILKVNARKDELTSEHNMLKIMRSTGTCKVYAFDLEHGVLIEEQILPGIPLRQEENTLVRIERFSEVFRNIHQTIDDMQGFSTYLDWLKKADAFCVNHKLDLALTHKMHRALCIGEELFEKYTDRVLLHGDLHHDNMILQENEKYCMIDPKGVIGPEIFDIPRFILNEMDFVQEKECKVHIDGIIELISQKLNYQRTDITKLFYMEVILSNVWNVESGTKPKDEQIEIASALLKEVRS